LRRELSLKKVIAVVIFSIHTFTVTSSVQLSVMSTGRGFSMESHLMIVLSLATTKGGLIKYP
jgi:hypothetical protein